MMAESVKDSNEEWLNNVDLCHPEVLSSAQLSRILELRSIPIDECQSDKDKLLALFYRTLQPLPQREYRPNRRGQLLLRKRAKLQKKRKNEESLSPVEKQMEPILKALKLTSTSPVKSPESTSRLKPPPNPVSVEKKKIQFNTKACNGSVDMRNTSSVVSKGKMIKIINDTLMSNVKVSSSNGSYEKALTKTVKNIEEEAVPPKKKHKPITWP